MSSRRFILYAMALFILGALPFLIVQPTAAASAGLSLGFSAPLGHVFIMVLLFLAGLCSALLPRDGLPMIPIAFTLMILIGGMLMLDWHLFPGGRFFILGAIICLCLLVGIAEQKITVLAILMMASLGFHLGGFYMAQLPSIASPMYFLLGVLLSLGMMLAIAVAFGVTLIGDNDALLTRLKQSPRLQAIRELLL